MASAKFWQALPLCAALYGCSALAAPDSFIPGVKWQIEIHEPLDTSAALVPSDALVWDVDASHVVRNPEIVSKLLKPEGGAAKIVLCYLSVGTLHRDMSPDSRPDEDLADFQKLSGWKYGSNYSGYPGESWFDVRVSGVLDLMEARMVKAKDAGCDGIDPDNVDGYKEQGDGTPQNGLNLGEDVYKQYLSGLATRAKKHGLMIGLKNAPELAADASTFTDFAVLEQCMDAADASEKCASWQVYVKAGKPVFQIEYPPSVQVSDDATVCSAGSAHTDEFTKYCSSGTAAAGNGNSGYSEILKLNGALCGLGNWTTYCDKNEPVFVHIGSEDSTPGPSGTASPSSTATSTNPATTSSQPNAAAAVGIMGGDRTVLCRLRLYLPVVLPLLIAAL